MRWPAPTPVTTTAVATPARPRPTSAQASRRSLRLWLRSRVKGTPSHERPFSDSDGTAGSRSGTVAEPRASLPRQRCRSVPCWPTSTPTMRAARTGESADMGRAVPGGACGGPPVVRRPARRGARNRPDRGQYGGVPAPRRRVAGVATPRPGVSAQRPKGLGDRGLRPGADLASVRLPNRTGRGSGQHRQLERCRAARRQDGRGARHGVPHRARRDVGEGRPAFASCSPRSGNARSSPWIETAAFRPRGNA